MSVIQKIIPALFVAIIALGGCSPVRVVPNESYTPERVSVTTMPAPALGKIIDIRDNSSYGESPKPPNNTLNYKTYIVQRGDTLYSIAKRHGSSSYRQIAAVNHIYPPYTISTGSILKIPYSQQTGKEISSTRQSFSRVFNCYPPGVSQNFWKCYAE